MSVTQQEHSDIQIVGGGVLAKLDQIETLLRNLDGDPVHVAVGAHDSERVLKNWPVTGHQRRIASARGRGGPALGITIPVNTYTDLLKENIGRIGISLINIGSNPCYVYLAEKGDAQNGGAAGGYLFAGGSWDGKISDDIWCGAVSVLSVLGTTLVLAEI